MGRMDGRKQKSERKGVWITVIAAVVLLVGGAAVFAGMNGWDPERIKGALSGRTPGQEQETDRAETDRAETEEPDSGGSVAGDGDAEEGRLPASGDTTKQPEADPLEGIGTYVDGRELPPEPTYIDGILLANKKYPLPSGFAPGESPEAREAFEEMAAEALLEGFDLDAFSTFRTFERQQELYDRYVERDGVEAADRYSARPGYSEHQTGFAFDIGEATQPEHYARESFGDTPAGQWLFANAHRYGFILRYPEGKEDVTGYMHESWHYRYVGKKVAGRIHSRGITLEEYLLVKDGRTEPPEPEK
ncbi:M15 family metallopeptidase [Bhargavaea beijingensis]|uniref:M15 family metallopeptidase n=1 Tax=Bhargavaea beijingensis TaxID=426756 RepID=UPI002224A797|nr:M15 family metallopeptidase [Bhargavaea beijingensis]MCW1927686.1 M15 family metallopeptidase [Bhargavaea beijingensis]